ncbi:MULTISPECIES: A24 family peptidase [unclassified Tatumella]|uniref:prepilin peptidase n=1 Tax=unclassified Tatumella TaxID=2649542 RepID=UPI001BAF7FD5|nr:MULTISPECIES: A24 family peptidase [unclassified Tatumella]MBS0878855.1 prepilin peptidase [Tatumella sp. JGM82]MBS0892332.1 prepilin peptidase [Tatumella sp. JGM94]MBS0903421.1 prepilin peptidase [Tatumella sp. JGM100]
MMHHRPEIMLLLFAFLFGTIAGSFCGLVSDRYRPWMSFRRQCRIICSPYSECAVCHHRLRWFELLPVISFLVLRSRCRYCRHPLPPRLLLFEAGGGIAGIIAGLALPDILPWFATVIFSALLSILADIDRRYLLLPDSLVFTVLCSGLLFAACFPALSLDARIAGICAGYSSLLIINYLYRYWRNTEGIGGGDMKLLAALGAWCGWQALAGIIVVATLLALSTLCCQGRLRVSLQKNTPLPLGFYLAIAGWGWFIVSAAFNYSPVL